MKAYSTQLLKTKTSKAILATFVFATVAVIHLGANGVSLQTVIARTTGPSFNTDSQDFATLRSANYTRFPDSTTNWASDTDADAGDTVSLTIYYHNTSPDVTAQNVHASVFVPGTSGTTISGSGKLSADNFTESDGVTTIHLSSSQSLSYIPRSAKWYPNQSTSPSPFPFGQSGDEFVTSAGVNLGDVAPGWETQGSVVARFKVSSDTVAPPPTATSTASTIDVTSNGSQGPLTLSDGQSFTVDWISSNVTNCSIGMDGVTLSGVDNNGSMGPIDPSHPYYPADGASHTFTVTCDGLSGNVSDSVVVTRTTPPPPPAPLADPQLTTTTGTQCGGFIDVSWTAVSGATSYKVFRNGSLVTTVSGTSFADSSLTPGISYTYSVQAVSATQTSPGNDQSVTSSSSVCGGNGVSTVDITASGSQGPLVLDGQSFTLDWISSNVTNCNLSSTDHLFTSGVEDNGSTGVIDPAHTYYPAAGTSRTFTITCQGFTGQVSDSVQVTRPQTVPLPPSAPTLSASTSTTCGGMIDLSWNAVSTATSYKIFRSGAPIATTTALTYSDSGLTAGQAFSYTVRSTSPAGDSVDSNTATATSSNACSNGGGATSSVDITANGSQGPVVLTQNQSFTVDWISSNVTNCVLSSTNLFSSGVAQNGTTGVIDPAHAYYPVAGGSRTFTITCQGVAGQVTDSVVVSRPVSPTAPAAPVISNILTTCSGQVTLSWSTVSGATSYKVFRNGAQVATTSALTFTDTGLTPGTLYTYTLKATNNVGDSPASDSASTTIPTTCATIPVAPAIFASTSMTCGGTIFVSWNAVSNATSYNVFRNGTLVATSSNVSFTDSGLTPGQSFIYTVQAVNAAGTSPSSNSATATSSAQCPLPTPTVTLTATPATISQGQNSTLSWTSTNATSCSALWTSATSTSGTQIVSPATTTTYSIACMSGAQSASATTTVTVTTGGGGGGSNNVSVTLTANPSTINLGATSTLSWTSTQATVCTAAWTSATSTSGTQIVSPATTTAYSINCSNTNTLKSNSATTTVTVVLPPACILPNLISPFTASGTVGTPFTYTFGAAGSTTPIFTVGTSTLPDGLTFSGDTISGTPTAAGTFTVPVTITNDCGFVADNTIIITIAPVNGGGGGSTVSVTLTANPGTVAPGATSTLTWVSTNATICSADFTSATTTSGSFDVTPQTTTAYTINCANGSQNATSTATVTVTEGGGNGGGGGGGGGCGTTCNSVGGGGGFSSGGGRSGGGGSAPLILGASASCEYLHDYMHIGWPNDPLEVTKLQVFLKYLDGRSDLQITRIFDQQTFDAVAKFQVEYQPDILTPWGYAQGEYTGYVYILTEKKINEIYCQKAFPLNGSQEQEIAQFRAFLEGLKEQGINLPAVSTTGVGVGSAIGSVASSALAALGNVGNTQTGSGVTTGGGILGNGSLRDVAAAVFAGPQSLGALLQALFVFLIALLAIYSIGEAVIRGQNKNGLLSRDAIITRRTSYSILGLIIAVILAFLFKYYVIILPLLILIIVLAVALLYQSLKKSGIQTTPAANPTVLLQKTTDTTTVKTATQTTASAPKVEAIKDATAPTAAAIPMPPHVSDEVPPLPEPTPDDLIDTTFFEG